MSNKNEFIKKLICDIDDRVFKVGVVGLGYVGLPLALAFASNNLPVIGFDIDHQKIDLLNDSKSYISHITNESIKKSKRQLNFSSTYEKIADCNAVILCLPTPLDNNQAPDLSYIKNTLRSIVPYLQQHQLIILESTTYPGTTDDIIIGMLSSKGYDVGENIFVCYSPEREDPGSKEYNTKNIPKIIAGATESCLELGKKLYEVAIEVMVPVSSLKAAELTKLLENIHRSVNIGLVNELKILADKMQIDLNEVIEAAATKPFGFTPYYPGPGLGGHCLPIDPFYLTWKAKEYGIDTKFIRVAGEINTFMPFYFVNKAIELLNSCDKTIKSSKILLIGVAYKKNVSDTRETPAAIIANELDRLGAELYFYDPYVAEFKTRQLKCKPIKLDDASLHGHQFDLAIVITNHDCIDMNIFSNAKLTLNTRE